MWSVLRKLVKISVFSTMSRDASQCTESVQKKPEWVYFVCINQIWCCNAEVNSLECRLHALMCPVSNVINGTQEMIMRVSALKGRSVTLPCIWLKFRTPHMNDVFLKNSAREFWKHVHRVWSSNFQSNVWECHARAFLPSSLIVPSCGTTTEYILCMTSLTWHFSFSTASCVCVCVCVCVCALQWWSG